MASPTKIAAAAVANVLLAASLTRAHPGTWQGKVIMNENGAPLPDLTGKWEPQHDAQKPFYLKLYQPLNDIAAPPNSTYAVLSYGEADRVDFHGICRLKAEYDYETRNRTATSVLCERRSRSQNDADRGLRGDDVSGFPWWDTQGFIVTAAGLRNETDFDRHKVSISFESEAAGTKLLVAKAPHDDGPLTGRFFTRGPGKAEIKKVHVVFANHYDVGYTDYINGVDNKYMHKYFPLAERTSDEMDSDPKSKDKFFYTTHPWIVYRFLTCTCPPDDEACMKNTLSQSLNNPFEPPLNCPTDTEVAAMEKAMRDRRIVHNSAPFNLQTEAMSPELLESGMKLSAWLDASLKIQGTTETMTIRDVMYVSKETLKFGRAGQRVKYLTIGSNGAGVPPQAPKLHMWNGTIVAYHPYGYGGFGLKDCAESPNGVALCTEFRTDNTGPPSNSKEVESVLDSVRKNYPHAEVIASTFDNFFADVEPVKDDLPKVDLEIGDTWMYGDASDPLKMRQHRAIQRAWVENCFSSAGEKLLCADYDNSPVVRNFTFFMMKTPEHTWGTPGLSGWGGGNEYRRDAFYRNYTSTDSVVFPNKSYMRASASWAEQRLFNELAVRAFEQGAEAHPEKYGRAAKAMREAVRSVSELVEPHTSGGLTGAGYVQLPSDQLVVELSRADDAAAGQPASQGATIRLDRSTGALASIRFARKDGSASRDFGEEMFGTLSYQLFNDTEWLPFSYAYMTDRQPQRGFTKPGSNSHTESTIFTPSVGSLWQRPGDRSDVVVELLFPDRSHKMYGAPRRAWLTASLAAPKAEKAERVGLGGGSWSLDLRFVLEEKMPTMVGESTSVNFPKRQGGFGNWRLPKLAGYIDPEGVLDGGNQFNHAVWGSMVAGAAGGASVAINSLDAPVVNPIVKSKFGGIGNPLPATYDEADARAGRGLSRLPKGSVEGVSCNVHNNLWNTNYPLFYPYYDPLFCPGHNVLACSDRHILARFELAFAEGGESEEAIVV